MAKITQKVEILVDLNEPVEEIQQCNLCIINSHPGKQLELLNQIDMWLGELISKIESVNQAKNDPVVKSTDI